MDKKTIFNLIKLKSIAKKLDLLNPKTFVLTVSGTNGKGSTCAIIETLLLNSGYKVGLYSSPHLISYVERVKVNGFFLKPNQHIHALKKVELARGSTLLSYFEFITLSALILFKQYKLDIIILEVGLGGRLDATNIIDSSLSLITNVGIDHSSILGVDRESIAREKSGIFRKNKISVIGEENVPNSMNQVAKKIGAILKKINIDWFWKKNNTNNNWNFIHPYIELYNLPVTDMPLSNISLALASIYYSGFKIHETIVRDSISKVKLPGRFQTISYSPRVILDVAHNPHASLKIFENLEKINVKGKIYAVLGVMKDKDIIGIINSLKKKINYWFSAPLKTIRTATTNQLKNSLPKYNTYILDSINQACKKAYITAEKEDIILIFGSFLTVSEFISQQSMDNQNKILNNIILENLCF